MLIVPDTNVLISGQLQSRGIEAAILKLWQHRMIQFALSEEILSEYRRVFLYPHIQKHIQWPQGQPDRLIESLRKGSFIVLGTLYIQDGASDLSDNKFLACAVEAKADVIVSGDEKHLQPLEAYRGIPILSPRLFVERYMLSSKARK